MCDKSLRLNFWPQTIVANTKRGEQAQPEAYDRAPEHEQAEVGQQPAALQPSLSLPVEQASRQQQPPGLQLGEQELARRRRG